MCIEEKDRFQPRQIFGEAATPGNKFPYCHYQVKSRDAYTHIRVFRVQCNFSGTAALKSVCFTRFFTFFCWYTSITIALRMQEQALNESHVQIGLPYTGWIYQSLKQYVDWTMGEKGSDFQCMGKIRNHRLRPNSWLVQLYPPSLTHG